MSLVLSQYCETTLQTSRARIHAMAYLSDVQNKYFLSAKIFPKTKMSHMWKSVVYHQGKAQPSSCFLDHALREKKYDELTATDNKTSQFVFVCVFVFFKEFSSQPRSSIPLRKKLVGSGNENWVLTSGRACVLPLDLVRRGVWTKVAHASV